MSDTTLWIFYLTGAMLTGFTTLRFFRQLKNDWSKVLVVVAVSALWPILWFLVFVSAMWEGPL